MRALTRFLLTALLAVLFAAAPAHAGRTCEARHPGVPAVLKAVDLAQQSLTRLEQSEAKVALIARVGADLSAYGLRYSHAALAWRDHPKGRWLVVHMLNHCGAPTADLFDDGLANFFLDDMFAYDALIAIPSSDVQERLAAALAHETAENFLASRYSMIAHPFSTRYQNSNQWLLELLAAALAPPGAIGDRAQAQAWLREVEFRPAVITISPLKRLGAQLFRANISFDDHSIDERLSGKFQVVSVESIVAFLRGRDAELARYELSTE
jgi:hypothetical protein